LNGEAANGLIIENLHEVEGKIMPIDDTKPIRYEDHTIPPINEEIEQEEGQKAVPGNQVIDTIEFTKGNDKLTIVLSKKHNRMFRVQVFLNDTTEMRPGTYTGASPAMSFWNLLKGSLKGTPQP
jgi:hypothetical protein